MGRIVLAKADRLCHFLSWVGNYSSVMNCCIDLRSWLCLPVRATHGRTIMVMLDESHLYTIRQPTTRLEPSERMIGLIDSSAQAPPWRRNPCWVKVRNRETVGHGDEKIDGRPRLPERSLRTFDEAVLTALTFCLKTDGLLPGNHALRIGLNPRLTYRVVIS
jgi:hypothetical protein